VASKATRGGLRGRACRAWALALGLVAPWAPTTAPAADDEVAPIYHKERSFRIPFDLGGQDLSRIKELQLWASEDAGYKWDPVSRTTPDQKVFTFRARRDGEYWFAVRTVSAGGQISPEPKEEIRPGLKVVVDTLPPSIVVESAGRQGPSAKVRWEVKDENIDLKSLALEYQAAGARDWRRVPIRRPAAIGSESWNAGTVESIRVRGTVVDRAGNQAETTIVLPDGASAPGDVAEFDAEAMSPPPVGPIGRQRGPIEVGDNNGFTPVDGEPAAPQGEARNWEGAGRRQIARPARAGSDALVNANPQPSGGGGAPAPAAAPADDPFPRGPAPAATNSRPGGFPDPFPNTAPAPNGDPFANADPGANGGGMAPFPGATAPAAGPGNGGGGGSTMLVGGPRFKLQYAVDDAGPGGPAIVELWVTNDGGRSWVRRGEDPDRTSPIDVDLGGEGTFGVSLVARSSSGLGDRAPAPGDMPQTWVEVDSTPPTVQLFPPQIGTGVHSGKVAISWRAGDLHLTPKPVSILWRAADQPGTSWNPVVEAQDASGQFIWTVPPHFPTRFYVRVEAVDTAGNRGGAETPESAPVLVDRSRPKSRIIGLDSDARSGDGPSAHPIR